MVLTMLFSLHYYPKKYYNFSQAWRRAGSTETHESYSVTAPHGLALRDPIDARHIPTKPLLACRYF
jgi:hypothetical protein